MEPRVKWKGNPSIFEALKLWIKEFIVKCQITDNSNKNRNSFKRVLGVGAPAAFLGSEV